MLAWLTRPLSRAAEVAEARQWAASLERLGRHYQGEGGEEVGEEVGGGGRRRGAPLGCFVPPGLETDFG